MGVPQRWVVSDGERKLPEAIFERLAASSLKAVRRLIASGRCSVNGRVRTFASTRVYRGDVIEIAALPPHDVGTQSCSIEYEDSWIVVVHKPPGLSVEEGAMAGALSRSCHLVHRLDKETSGILITAKDGTTQKILEQMFRDRIPSKEYLAIIDGKLAQASGVVHRSVACIQRTSGQTRWGVSPSGKSASTQFVRIMARPTASLVRLIPITGRTHQIRVHMASLGHPILGDYRYSDRFSCHLRPARQMLHAWRITLPHPILGTVMTWESPIPEDMRAVAVALFGPHVEDKICAR